LSFSDGPDVFIEAENAVEAVDRSQSYPGDLVAIEELDSITGESLGGIYRDL
jgi:hypothetical protein